MRLAADDLTPGMFVTVLETEGAPRPEPGVPGVTKPTKDYTGAGAVLRVVSLSLPFVLVQNMTPGMLRGPRMFPLDLRRTTLSPLSDDYVRAAMADPPPKHEPISVIDAEVIQADEDDSAEPSDRAEPPRQERAPGRSDDDDFGNGIYFLGGGS